MAFKDPGVKAATPVRVALAATVPPGWEVTAAQAALVAMAVLQVCQE
jgi:hypothetical protein